MDFNAPYHPRAPPGSRHTAKATAAPLLGVPRKVTGSEGEQAARLPESQILGCLQTGFKVYFTAVWICPCLQRLTFLSFSQDSVL